MSKSKKVDMLNGPLAWKIVLFALPLALSSILQQLFNSVDVAVIGQFAKEGAQAAVGANVANVAIFVNLLVGLSVGADIVVARLIGKGDHDAIPRAVHTAISVAIILGIVIGLLGQFFADLILDVTGTPATVLTDATIYFRIYLLGIPFITVYNFGAAIFRSIGDTKKPLICLVISGLSNVGLNLWFVLGFHWDVVGVAVATVASNVINAVMIVAMLMKSTGYLKLSIRKLRIYGKEAAEILKAGIPSGLQGTLFAVSNVFIQTAINGFGDIAIAGSSIALNFEYFAFYTVSSFSQATVTFSSQNFGAGNIKRCGRVVKIAMIEGLCITQALCTVFILFRYFFAGLYTPDGDILEYAVTRMMCVVIVQSLVATYDITCAAMRSVGQYLIPSIIIITGTVVYRFIWLNTVFAKWHDFRALLGVYISSWIITGIAAISFWLFIYRRRKKSMRSGSDPVLNQTGI